MPTRFDGFYFAAYEGLNEDARFGRGVVVLKDGRIFGGDSLSCFVGTFVEANGVMTANVKVVPFDEHGYASVGGFINGPWELPDIRGPVPQEPMPPNVEIKLEGQRYAPTHHAISLRLVRLVAF
jgi:T3SS negative regulator,GrlR